jgi:hypothetical protein
MAGGPVLLALFLFYIGIAATIPFLTGLLGFSRRITYFLTIALASCIAYFEITAFPHDLKYQNIYRLLLVDIAGLGLCALELLIAFVLAHWLGARLRAGAIWASNRLLRA